jgi:L-2-hydroxyglutarate oxidase LhgO
MMPDFDSVVVGAGVIGLTVARALALAGHRILVLEKASRAGTETSSRNSEVIHAGIYYPKGSLKAELCVEGRDLLYAYCAAKAVPHRCIGKLIVATSLQEEAKLETIKAQAEGNGVHDLKWLSQAEAHALEPEVRCTKALFSPSTGIVDASNFMLTLQGDAEAEGANFAFNATCTAVQKKSSHFTIVAVDASGEETEVTCKHVINCAGHGAHAVASSAMGVEVTRLPPRYIAKGSYCSLSGRAPFTHLIYPVPVSGALGIHATLDLAGAVRFGPDITWIDSLDYTLSPDLPQQFSAAVEAYWPAVRNRTLTPTYCGIRPKIHGPDSGFADFHIQDEREHGIAGLVNLFGIESPGLTSSLALAARVAARLDVTFSNSKGARAAIPAEGV